MFLTASRKVDESLSSFSLSFSRLVKRVLSASNAASEDLAAMPIFDVMRCGVRFMAFANPFIVNGSLFGAGSGDYAWTEAPTDLV